MERIGGGAQPAGGVVEVARADLSLPTLALRRPKRFKKWKRPGLPGWKQRGQKASPSRHPDTAPLSIKLVLLPKANRTNRLSMCDIESKKNGGYYKILDHVDHVPWQSPPRHLLTNLSGVVKYGP